MSKATKRKYVTQEVLDEFVLPEGDQLIARVLGGRGNNLHEIEDCNGENYLVTMPTKFRKNVWIKRGDFVIVKPIEEGDKVKAEIVNILYKEQIKYVKENKLWPTRFESEDKANTNDMIPSDMLPPSDPESDDNDGEFNQVNPNRPLIQYGEYDEDSSSDEEQDQQ